MTGFDVVVLAGGSARRMGGVDKAAVVVKGMTLLDRVLLATSDARTTVVVGPWRPTVRPVTWTREEPAGGGPVPALAAGLSVVTAPVTVLLAADLPFLTPSCVRRLVVASPGVLTDEGRAQWLCGAWPTEALRTAVQALDETAGARLGPLLETLEPARLVWEGDDRPWTDCDTEEDVLRAREIA